MGKFGKILIWTLVFVAIMGAIYLVLPEQPKASVQSVFQPMFNTEAKARMDQVKNLKNGELKRTYANILEPKVKMASWVYQKDEAGERVIFYGSSAYINIQDIEGVSDMLYTSSSVKMVFNIGTDNSVKIDAYIDGKLQPEAVKQSMFYQLAGMTQPV